MTELEALNVADAMDADKIYVRDGRDHLYEAVRADRVAHLMEARRESGHVSCGDLIEWIAILRGKRDGMLTASEALSRVEF